jgi:predicted nucleic acid-binding protein
LIYFDTDVLINFIVIQSADKHVESQRKILDAIKEGSFCISFLSIQEMLFVLQKIGVEKETIGMNYNFFRDYANFQITKEVFDRAYDLASELGFQNINDCIHTALAEKYCQKLVTYNRDDFKKIQNLSTLEISIL